MLCRANAALDHFVSCQVQDAIVSFPIMVIAARFINLKHRPKAKKPKSQKTKQPKNQTTNSIRPTEPENLSQRPPSNSDDPQDSTLLELQFEFAEHTHHLNIQ